ncbi:hypothetical protein VTH06DRAFT_711 [Thermothelomyces fergusii]
MATIMMSKEAARRAKRQETE